MFRSSKDGALVVGDNLISIDEVNVRSKVLLLSSSAPRSLHRGKGKGTNPSALYPVDAFDARGGLVESFEFASEAVDEDASEVPGLDVVDRLVWGEQTEARDERRGQRQV